MHHSLSLQSSDASIALNDVLGRIAFAASNETGSDALKVAAIVSAIAEGDFDATSNPTSLVFSTGHSETATEKMRITSQGDVGIGTDDPLHKLEIRYNASSDDGLAVLREGSTNDGILIGEQAYPVNDDYQGITHPLYGTSDYMLISRGDHTYMSAKSGYGSYIRSGANGTSYQLYIGPNEASIATNALRVTSSECVLNEAGGNRDFRVEGDGEQNLLFVDASTDRIGVHTAFPQKDFHVQGTTALRGNTILGGSNIPSASQSIKVVDDSIFSDTATFNTDIVASSGVTLSNAIPATTTNKLYNDAGTLMWDGSEVGSGGSSNLVRGSFAVTSSTTVFTVSGGYNTGSLDVYQNGVKLFKGSSYDFTETGGGTTFTLANAATNGDLIEYVALNASTSATGNTSLSTVSVTSNQTDFSTTDTISSTQLVVFLNGVKLVEGTSASNADYEIVSSNLFRLHSTAVSGDVVEYIIYGATVASSNLAKTGDTMTGNLTVNADLIVTGYKETHTDNGNTGTAQTIDISSSTLQTYTLTGNCTFTMPTAEAGRSFTMFLKTGAGSFTSTFTGVKFPLNTAPTITTDANRMDLITFYSDGTNWYGNIQQEYHV